MAADQRDQAANAITEILGVSPDLPHIQQIATGESILSSMSHALNGAALLVATVLILWSTFSAAANTAHEGKLFGRRYHSMWVPLRSAISVGMLLPIINGYSLVQIGVIAFAGMGFQSADLAWRAALDHIRNSGPVVQVSPIGSEALLLALYKSNLCMLRLNSLRSGTAGRQIIAVRQQQAAASGELRYRLSFDGVGGNGLSRGACGDFRIAHDANGVGKLMHESQKNSIRQMSLELNRLALAQINGGMSQRQIAARLNEIGKQRTTALRAAASRALSVGKDSVSQANRQFFKEAQQAGWMMAGSWFWTISSINRRIADTLRSEPRFKLPNPTYMPADWRAEIDKELLHVDRAVIPKMDSADLAGARKDGFGGLYDRIASWTHQPMAHLLDAFNEILNDSGEPVVRLQSLGHSIIGTAELLLAAAVAGQAAGTGALAAAKGNVFTNAGNFLAGGGGGLEFLSAVGSILLDWAAAIVAMLAVPILLCGLMLAYWLPALPFVYWMASIVGWLILLVEAVLVAPLWACAHAAAEGEGISSHFARPGYMMILSLVMRPMLMIMGLFAAMLITHWASSFLLVAFTPFVRGMHTGHLTGIVSIIAMLMLLTTLVIAMANRVYELIYTLPGRIMNYVGDMPGWGGHGIGGDALAHIGNSHYGSIGETVRQSIPMERK